jgi:hypothetical protein
MRYCLKNCIYVLIFFVIGCSNRINTDGGSEDIGVSLISPFDREAKLIRKLFGEPPKAMYGGGVLYEEYEVGETVIRIEYHSKQSRVDP